MKIINLFFIVIVIIIVVVPIIMTIITKIINLFMYPEHYYSTQQQSVFSYHTAFPYLGILILLLLFSIFIILFFKQNYSFIVRIQSDVRLRGGNVFYQFSFIVNR